jgi:cytochrome P450 monooxygenase
MDFLFGASPESQSLGFETEKKDFLDAFEEVLGGIGRRIFRGKLSAVIPDPGFKKACIKAKLFADKYVDAAVERFHHAEGGTKAERYIFLNKMAKQTTDRTYLRNNLLAVFVAGHESTANLLTNCLFLTSRRPDVWKKLRQEVLDVQDKPITFELLKSLRYLHYVLNESE